MKEVCCRHFVDISDGENGFALMSGEKFGYDIKNCILSINLVRNSTCPRDVPPTDTGSHRIRFAAYVHSGDSGNGVVREAELFANPLHPYTKSLLSAIPIADPVIERNREPMVYQYEKSGLKYNDCVMVNVSETHQVLMEKKI